MTMYGRKTPSTYRSTPSVYSHYTGKSSTNLRSSKSVRSLRVPWYQKPILHDAWVLDLQRGSLLTGFISVFIALFSFAQSIFDLYCLGMAAPGSVHYGYYVISFQFVYVGSPAVRNVLIVFALFSWIGSVVVLVTSIILIIALRKEYEKRMVAWLYAFGVFISFRLIAFLFASIVNDMIFAYNIFMCLCWIVFIVCGAYGWLLVYSLYLELSDLTKLEDLAHLRMGTMASLNASLAGSRPTTPHSTVSTMPASQI
ncbi:uncharacterized protein LOC123871157 [Maniola jurtina]|uniref:uncharacterized protein LOC123871157 n=1 Tax=Maniola jurtina TaxID=191418 RepID=UPI001E687CA0|nr:uncharacterized protein LOC123871157 [Maniola jurtina]XP_045770741.1 uncharacterized protein LOC123871157 [Maniola jurtina]XP_045770742.1 uncharacterized protein LOC123871157 [Maniola jurtina]